MELDELRASARTWLVEQRRAATAPTEDWGPILPPRLADAGRAWQRRIHDAGFAGLSWPAAYGGRELTPAHDAAWGEECSAAGVPAVINMVGMILAAQALLKFGTDAQKDAYLEPTARGELVWCQLFSEPGAGSDLASLSTRAVRDGDEWVVTGQKVWSSGARISDLGLLLARTDPDAPRHRGISMFVLDMHRAGVDVRPLRQMTGDAEFDEVFFDAVRIPGSSLLGPLHGGWGVAMSALTNERGFIASAVNALGRRVDTLAAAGGDQRIALLTRARALAALNQRQGPVASVASSLVKLGVAELSFEASVATVDAAGLAGLLEGPAARAACSAPGARLGGGTSEVQRTIIGERVLGLPAEPAADPRVVLAAGALALVALAAAHLALASAMRVPIIQPDELGYLTNARYLARGGLRSEVEYYPGFSILLVPLWLISSAPTAVFRLSLVVEAALTTLGAWLAWRLAPSLVPGLMGWRRALAVALVCAYPASLLYSDFALSEVAFATMFLVVCAIAARAVVGRDVRWWGALGLASGALAMVHPRGFAVMVAVGIAGVFLLGLRRDSAAPGAAMAIGMALAGGVTRILVATLKSTTSLASAYRPDSVIGKSLSPYGIASLLAEVVGQLWYLSVATFGLVPLALVLGVRCLLRVRRGDRRPWALLQAFVTLSFMGVWALSSMFMNLGNRADKLVYGRYNEGVIVPLLLIAAGDLLMTRGTIAVRRWASISVASILGTGLILQLSRSAKALRGDVNPANILGLASLLHRMGGHLHPVAMSVTILAAVAVFCVVAWRLPAVALLAAIAVFVWSSADLQRTYISPGTRARSAQDDIVDAVRLVHRIPGVDTSCVAWDPDSSLDYNLYNDRFLLPTQLFEEFDLPGSAPCGSLIVTSKPSIADRFPGARVITGEAFVNERLWAIPRAGDPTFDALAARGFLAPASPSGTAATPLPATDLQGARLTAVRRTVLASGATATLPVTISHPAGGAPWPAVGALASGNGVDAVRLAVRWTAVPGAISVVELPSTLLPGERVTVRVRLAAKDATGTPVAPGIYTAQLGLFQAGVGSFSDPPVNVTVTVT